MEINSKKIERTSKFIYFIISMLLCIFLILFSNNIIADMDKLSSKPLREDFENSSLILTDRVAIKKYEDSIKIFDEKKNLMGRAAALAKSNYENEKESFENWIKTRTTIGSPQNDQDVILRAKKLDDFYSIEQEWRKQILGIDDQISELNKLISHHYSAVSDEQERAYKLYLKAYRKYDLYVFLTRLLFAAPILFLGIWFFVKYRKNKYWPLHRGFFYFSLYAFFFGLVPYLPSYGGYIRYSAGILLCVFAGYYSINRFRAYIEQKKIELESSSSERAKNVKLETAEKALLNHVCPSCGKDYILKNWEHSSTVNEKPTSMIADFCRFCGLELFRKCEVCDHKNFIHLPFCSSCGHKNRPE
jgi:ribosomal protein L32